jgi:hypothetical protein
VRLLVYYVIFMISGDIVDYMIGLGIERLWPDAKQVSLVIFLALYFLSLWVAWLLAVWLSKPKKETPATG